MQMTRDELKRNSGTTPSRSVSVSSSAYSKLVRSRRRSSRLPHSTARRCLSFCNRHPKTPKPERSTEATSNPTSPFRSSFSPAMLSSCTRRSTRKSGAVSLIITSSRCIFNRACGSGKTMMTKTSTISIFSDSICLLNGTLASNLTFLTSWATKSLASTST